MYFTNIEPNTRREQRQERKKWMRQVSTPKGAKIACKEVGHTAQQKEIAKELLGLLVKDIDGELGLEYVMQNSAQSKPEHIEKQKPRKKNIPKEIERKREIVEVGKWQGAKQTRTNTVRRKEKDLRRINVKGSTRDINQFGVGEMGQMGENANARKRTEDKHKKQREKGTRRENNEHKRDVEIQKSRISRETTGLKNPNLQSVETGRSTVIGAKEALKRRVKATQRHLRGLGKGRSGQSKDQGKIEEVLDNESRLMSLADFETQEMEYLKIGKEERRKDVKREDYWSKKERASKIYTQQRGKVNLILLCILTDTNKYILILII